MRLYNTLSKQIEQVTPLQAPRVTVYTCGPTVYDYPHIGNWFTFIRYDILVRALTISGLDPLWVMNITDVGHLVSDADDGEDKLEKGAKREGKTAWDVAKYYGDYFITALERLNFIQPDIIPKATEHIKEQIALIAVLERKGYAYIISDGVYFDTALFSSYADFAGLDLDEQQDGARVEHNPEKRNASDFALWKFSPKDQNRDMEWDSPWGKGFPGWHIECSAMSQKYLSDTIDIHSGGIDHIPVHHSNEIAQSEAATGKQFARMWMHTNHILINDEKISKSLGNGITLEDIESRGYCLEALRLHVLESHYRSQSKFSWESMEAAQNRLKSYQAMADLKWQPIQGSEEFIKDFNETITRDILEPLLNDLNTPQVLANLFSEGMAIHDQVLAENQVEGFQMYLEAIDKALGLKLSARPDITDQQKQLIKDRDEARAQKNWQESDRIRDELAKTEIGIRDTPYRTIWYRL